jgi:AraC-like DNA-binding protein
MRGLIHSASLSRYAEVARSVGLNPARMLREFRLPQRSLREPDVLLPIDSVRQLLETSAARSGVESFGLRMAEARHLSDMGALGLLVREQPTLRLALEALTHHANRINETLHLAMEEGRDVVVLREELLTGGSRPVRQATELAVGVVFGILRSFLGPHWLPRRVCFAHAAPHDLSVHKRLLGSHVEFGQPFNGIVCATRELGVSNPNADPGIERLARRLLSVDPIRPVPDLSTRVRHLVAAHVGGGSCRIGTIALQLGIGRRTIHRRLREEGTTFSDIVVAVQRELATRYVHDPRRSLAELAVSLGFATPSAFSRWYRRQFGETALAQRRRTANAARGGRGRQPP